MIENLIESCIDGCMISLEQTNCCVNTIVKHDSCYIVLVTPTEQAHENYQAKQASRTSVCFRSYRVPGFQTQYLLKIIKMIFSV